MSIDLSRAWSRLRDEYKTISGAEIDEEYGGYFEMYRDMFLDRLHESGCTDAKSLESALNEVIEFENVGDFLGDPDAQLDMLAAFGLVMLDRIARLNWGRSDYSECFFLHEALFECFEYVHENTKRTESARLRAGLAHKEHRAMKAEVFTWLDSNMTNHKSMDSAAEAIAGKVVPIKFRTARSWVTDWKKLRFAGTP